MRQILHLGSASGCWLKNKAEAVWQVDCLDPRKIHSVLSSLMNEVSTAWRGEEGRSGFLTCHHCQPMEEAPLKKDR